MVFRKPNFGPPPPSYIAGLGRGASGFITRGDLGPAKIGEAPPGLGAPPGLNGQATKPSKEDYSDANYDEWNGFGGSLFAGLKEDAEDRDAEQAFAKVEDYIDGRRKQKRQEKARELTLKYASETMTFQGMFSDQKKDLSTVSREEWEALPIS